MSYGVADPVTVSLGALESGTLFAQCLLRSRVLNSELGTGTVDFASLEAAFGPDSLGIIVVSGLPEKFVALRRRLLSYASHLGNLPAGELAALECMEAKYLVGW